MKKPLLILLSLVIVLALTVAVGVPMWASREQRISEIPADSICICEELSVTLDFGRTTTMVLPDGTAIEVGIDYGRRIMELGGDSVDGWYEAHLEDGYVEITFAALPIPFEPDRPYRFAVQSD